jgi:hypothetical protein
MVVRHIFNYYSTETDFTFLCTLFYIIEYYTLCFWPRGRATFKRFLKIIAEDVSIDKYSRPIASSWPFPSHFGLDMNNIRDVPIDWRHGETTTQVNVLLTASYKTDSISWMLPSKHQLMHNSLRTLFSSLKT